MSTSQIVWLVIGVLAALGVVGIVGLVVLWGTASNPGRSAVRKEVPAEEIDRYIERGAAFAIVLTERTPLSRREVWDRSSTSSTCRACRCCPDRCGPATT